MQVFSEVLRAHIVPGLNEIKKGEESTFKGWVTNSKYRIDADVARDQFTLIVEEPKHLLSAFAYDINRMASSSFETLIGIAKEEAFPKSVGWLMIRSYYSAYFAAHSILRFFGISCSQFDSQQVRAVVTVAKLYGYYIGVSPKTGPYSCHFSSIEQSVQCRPMDSSHKGLWKAFYLLIEDLKNKISASNDHFQADRDETVTLLIWLSDCLTKGGQFSESGNWLSSIRNEVNYSHAMSAWFPYSGPKNRTDLFRVVGRWKERGISTNDLNADKFDARQYLDTCMAITTIAKELVLELDSVSDDSFLKHGAMNCLNRCKFNHDTIAS